MTVENIKKFRENPELISIEILGQARRFARNCSSSEEIIKKLREQNNKLDLDIAWAAAIIAREELKGSLTVLVVQNSSGKFGFCLAESFELNSFINDLETGEKVIFVLNYLPANRSVGFEIFKNLALLNISDTSSVGFGIQEFCRKVFEAGFELGVKSAEESKK